MGVTTYSVGNYDDVTTMKFIKVNFTENSKNAEYIKFEIIPRVESLIKQRSIEVIMVPSSSSKLLKYFGNELSKKTGIPIIEDSFVKSLPSEIEIDTGGIAVDSNTIKRLYQIVQNSERVGYFELKKVPVQFRKFFVGYIKLNRDKKSFIDKNVLVVDDILTSGATLTEIYRILHANGANAITGLTLAKKRR
jgi:phosphoribosylpyrophosphate synthetase